MRGQHICAGVHGEAIAPVAVRSGRVGDTARGIIGAHEDARGGRAGRGHGAVNRHGAFGPGRGDAHDDKQSEKKDAHGTLREWAGRMDGEPPGANEPVLRTGRAEVASATNYEYSLEPFSLNSRAFSSRPVSRAVSSVIPCSRAYSRTSSVIFIEQKFGPHIEQKCAVFMLSLGNVSS